MPPAPRDRLSALLAVIVIGGTACAESHTPADSADDRVPTTPLAAILGGGDTALASGVFPLSRNDDGAPSMVIATTHLPAVAGASATEAAKGHLRTIAAAYGARTLPDLGVEHVLRRAGGSILVELRQEIDGVEIHRSRLRVLLGPDLSLSVVSGTLVEAGNRAKHRSFDRSPSEALEASVLERYGVPIDASPASQGVRGWTLLHATSAAIDVHDARALRVHTMKDGLLEPAYAIEYFASAPDETSSRAFLDVVHARTLEILDRADLTQDDAFGYRVYADTNARPLAGPHQDFDPHPAGFPNGTFPDFVPSSIAVVESLKIHPVGEVDPWLPTGAQVTLGNNADAYADLHPPDGFSAGDYRAEVTSAGMFDRQYDFSGDPLALDQSHAAITQLFYTVNYLHDYWYDSGFDEARGNAQHDNFGRGGIAGDRMRLEAHDAANDGQRNNANMSTPGDGSSPRMQVYLWTERESRRLTVDPPGGTLPSGTANFGPASYDVTAPVAIALDGVEPVTDGCSEILNDDAIEGKIALVDRGGCFFQEKSAHAEQAGAIGVLVVNNLEGAGATNMDAVEDGPPVTIPTMMVSYEDGMAIRASLESGEVIANLSRSVTATERDGALDATLVQHEWGHYLHHRLSSCLTHQCGAMSEGWADFVALHAQLRAGDDPAGAYAIGKFAIHSAEDHAYYGLRRMPYSTDPEKNALRFRHVASGVELPTEHPIAASGSPDNAQVHNAGEVWGSALFEAYASVLEGRPFEEGRRAFADYIVGGLLLTPPDATFTETRDALLIAANSIDPDDAHAMAAAFAERGFGTCAISPARTSASFTDLVEDESLGSNVRIASVVLLDDVESCEPDGILDAGERGRIVVTLVNGGAFDGMTSLSLHAEDERLIIDAPERALTVPAWGHLEVEFGAQLAEGTTDDAIVEVVIEALTDSDCVGSQLLSRFFRTHIDARQDAATRTTFRAGAREFRVVGEAASSVWVLGLDAESDLGFLRGWNLATASDTALITPPLEVSPTEPFTLTFDHRYSFEANDVEAGPIHWDGAVVEFSIDGGATYQDVATLTTPGYDATIQDTFAYGNPLAGRSAYGGRNASFPSADRTTLSFGTALAGKTVQLRFRIGTDIAIGDEGWTIHAIEAAGLVHPPFAALVPPAGCDGAGDGGAMDGGVGLDGSTGGGCGCSVSAEKDAVGAALPLLLVILFRRRRR